MWVDFKLNNFKSWEKIVKVNYKNKVTYVGWNKVRWKIQIRLVILTSLISLTVANSALLNEPLYCRNLTNCLKITNYHTSWYVSTYNNTYKNNYYIDISIYGSEILLFINRHIFTNYSCNTSRSADYCNNRKKVSLVKYHK